MTETSFYWNGLVTGDASLAPYSSDIYHTLWQKLFTKTDNQGVVDTYLNELAVAGVSGGVQVASGAALDDGSFYENSATVSVPIPTPVTNPRIDRVVVQKDWANQTIRIARVAGTEAGAPTAPALTQTVAAIWEIPLAQVLITTAGVITVTDERALANTPLGPGQDVQLIETITSPGTSFDFTDIPQIFKHLKIHLHGRHTGGFSVEGLAVRFNADAGANYNLQNFNGTNATASATPVIGRNQIIAGGIVASGATANFASGTIMHIPNYVQTTLYKTLLSEVDAIQADALANHQVEEVGGIWLDTSAIDRITIFSFNSPGNAFVTGSLASLYGIN